MATQNLSISAVICSLAMTIMMFRSALRKSLCKHSFDKLSSFLASTLNFSTKCVLEDNTHRYFQNKTKQKLSISDGCEGWILDISYHMPPGNPEIGLAEIVDIEMAVEIVFGESNTTSKSFSMDFIKFSVVKQHISYSSQRVKSGHSKRSCYCQQNCY